MTLAARHTPAGVKHAEGSSRAPHPSKPPSRKLRGHRPEWLVPGYPVAKSPFEVRCIKGVHGPACSYAARVRRMAITGCYRGRDMTGLARGSQTRPWHHQLGTASGALLGGCANTNPVEPRRASAWSAGVPQWTQNQLIPPAPAFRLGRLAAMEKVAVMRLSDSVANSILEPFFPGEVESRAHDRGLVQLRTHRWLRAHPPG